VYVPGKTPVLPFNFPVHQSSAFSVLSTNSILSPAENDKSPSAFSISFYNINKKEETDLSLEIKYGSSIFSSIRRFRLEWGRWRWCLLFDGSRREGRGIWRGGYDGTRSRRWEFLLVG
jgi:hypothetical protein